MAKVIGFTGTRRGMTTRQVETLTKLLRGGIATLHHGGALGADREAVGIAERLGIACVGHVPAEHNPKALLARNHDIVAAVDGLIAAPHGIEEQARSGTWATVRYARAARKPVVIIWPDGTLTRE
jgi:hypothetical protein